MSSDLPKLGRLIRVPLREVWNDETRIFTPWLELPENLEVLGDALGLPALVPFSREHTVGRYSADLVCQIGDTNEFLLIENQIEISDHKHLGQLLTYLGGLEAQEVKVRYVVWLAEDFRDEHRDAIAWLNHRLDDHVGFFACRIEAWQIGTSARAPRFDVVVEPRQITIPKGSEKRSPEPQGVDVNRVAYWGAFEEEVRRRNLPLKLRSEPPRMGFYTFTLSGSLGIYLYAYRVIDARALGAYVSISNTAPPLPRLVFELLQLQRAEIDGEFGDPLQWNELAPDKKYRVQVDWIDGDPLDESDWPRQHAWLVDQVEKLYRIFLPRVQRLPPKEQLLARNSKG